MGCPISRPSVPVEYYDFRAQLQTAVTDTAMVEMEGLPRMQDSLQARLPDLAAILTVDSLLAALDASPTLSPLAGATASTVRMELNAENVGGGVRRAFQNPDGQRQAVDAIVIGLGRAVHLSRSSVEKEMSSRSSGSASALGEDVRSSPRRRR
jgi:hypothetical protein